MNILITGISGLIGSLLATELSQRHNVRGLSRSNFGDYEHVNASITDYDAMLPAFKDIDVVVHLAAFRADEPVTDLLKTNIEGTHNVYRAAVESGVSRVVFASSGGVIRGYLGGKKLTDHPAPLSKELIVAETAPWPIRLYDATKAAGEAIARVFHENHGLESVCVRIGKCVENDVPVGGLIRPIWVSQRDITQLLTRCIEHPGRLGFEIVHGMSNNRPAVVDIDRAKRVFGYQPQDGCDWGLEANAESAC